jgi:hypothetical protein
LVLGLALAGCHSGTLPDPNDPGDGEVSPRVLRDTLSSINDSLAERRLRHEISNDEYHGLIAKAASELVKELDLSAVDPSEAWEYAEVLRAGRNFTAAKKMLEIAVEHAKETRNPDRFVNDTLRLAHVQAELGQAQSAIETCQTVMDARPSDSAPILMSVLYEIAPAARNHGHDVELAKLLEQAVKKHESTTVDANTQAGHDFVLARPHHIARAYALAAELYDKAGMTAEATAAMTKVYQSTFDFEQAMKRETAKTGRAPGRARLPGGRSRL